MSFASSSKTSAALTGLASPLAACIRSIGSTTRASTQFASMLIGAVLAGVALLLADESRDLLIGESSDPQTVVSIRRIAMQAPHVRYASVPLTVHLGPDDLLVAMCVEIEPGLSGREQADVIARLERDIRGRHPAVKRAYLEVV